VLIVSGQRQERRKTALPRHESSTNIDWAGMSKTGARKSEDFFRKP
jgi:hypothetical protein